MIVEVLAEPYEPSPYPSPDCPHGAIYFIARSSQPIPYAEELEREVIRTISDFNGRYFTIITVR